MMKLAYNKRKTGIKVICGNENQLDYKKMREHFFFIIASGTLFHRLLLHVCIECIHRLCRQAVNYSQKDTIKTKKNIKKREENE